MNKNTLYTVYTLLTVSCSLLLGEDAIDPESLQFIEQMAYLENLTQSSNHDCQRKDKKCPTELFKGEEAKDEPHLRVFISFSAPLETWKSYSQELEKIKGSFVLRGLPGNSFRQLALKIKALKESGVNASILIDPEAFEKHRIKEVPTLVLEKGARVDQIIGNLPIAAALRLFAESGDLRKEAREQLARLNTQQGRGDG